MALKEIGVDPNPLVAGKYVVDVENIMFAMAEEWYFDGETWDIPWQFKDRRCWWFDE